MGWIKRMTTKTEQQGQFGSFDGLDNRKAVMDLFARLGDGLDEHSAARKRAAFLQGLIKDSTKQFSRLPFHVTPCDTVQAYHLFIAITGVLGVPIEKAARKLEEVCR